MRLISLVIVALMVAVTLTAQVDSTFVRHYYPTYSTHPYWQNYPIGRTFAANVLETYNGDFCLQILSEYHTPPPEYVIFQSPLAIFSRDGQYTETVFCPFEEYYGGFRIISGYYSTIVKDGLGGYLALDLFEHRLHRLDNNFHYVGYVPLISISGHLGSIRDIIKVDDGWIAIGSVSGIGPAITKFDNSLTALWEHTFATYQMNYTFASIASDGGCVYMWWDSPYYKFMKISSEGDSLWTKQFSAYYRLQQLVEVNNKYYGFVYHSHNNTTAELRIYDLGIDFENENPEAPILVIPTYPLLDNNMEKKNPFYVTRTSDDCIILAISTPNAEIFKYDSDLNLLWTSNALDYERIGRGDHPLLELPNGDFVYCAGVSVYPRVQIESGALVRINANGDYVGVEDDIETPAVSPMITAYPNPFNRELNVELKEKHLSLSKVEIYNVKGQLIDSLTLQDNKSNWMPRNLASGVYILKLLSNSKLVESKKITYIR
ncbi:MAG: T9SS type A sorting domain-containing protein [Candidatus Cloacimonetes bacterium]|nr:T9SS type A sorting domain-containing protein [Candidatus Cloacimonadota bacterium]